jgi:hypothetical protein
MADKGSDGVVSRVAILSREASFPALIAKAKSREIRLSADFRADFPWQRSRENYLHGYRQHSMSVVS